MKTVEGSRSGHNVVAYDYVMLSHLVPTNLQCLMETLRLCLGGKPKCIVTLWV